MRTFGFGTAAAVTDDANPKPKTQPDALSLSSPPALSPQVSDDDPTRDAGFDAACAAPPSPELPDALRPLIFMHGVGVGLLGYVPLIANLDWAAQHRPVFLVETPLRPVSRFPLYFASLFSTTRS